MATNGAVTFVGFCLSVAPIAQSPHVSISMDWALIREPK